MVAEAMRLWEIAKVRKRVRRAPDSDVFALEVWLHRCARVTM